MTNLQMLCNHVRSNQMDPLGYFALADHLDELAEDDEDFIVEYYRRIGRAIQIGEWKPKLFGERISDIRTAVLGCRECCTSEDITVIVSDHCIPDKDSTCYLYMERPKPQQPYIAEILSSHSRLRIDYPHAQIIECSGQTGECLKIYCHPQWVIKMFPFFGDEDGSA